MVNLRLVALDVLSPPFQVHPQSRASLLLLSEVLQLSSYGHATKARLQKMALMFNIFDNPRCTYFTFVDASLTNVFAKKLCTVALVVLASRAAIEKPEAKT